MVMVCVYNNVMTQTDLDSYFDNSKRECKFWKSDDFAKFSKNSYLAVVPSQY